MGVEDSEAFVNIGLSQLFQQSGPKDLHGVFLQPPFLLPWHDDHDLRTVIFAQAGSDRISYRNAGEKLVLDVDGAARGRNAVKV